jgi:L-aspartate oxidase
MTGREVERVLLERARQNRNIRFFENHMAIDLITFSTRIKRGLVTTTHEDYCCGAYVLDRQSHRVLTFGAGITLLATGGAGKVYLYTSNPDIATGDGIAMGYRAGATVANLEFVQFHPTCLYHPAAKNFLISEAVRGEGGRLMDADGNPSWSATTPKKTWPAGTWWPVPSTRNSNAPARTAYFWTSPTDPRIGDHRFPNLYEKCLSLRHRHDQRTDPRGAGRPLHVRRRGHRHVRPHGHQPPVRRGRNRLHRPPRRQPAGQQLPAGGPGLRRCRRPPGRSRTLAKTVQGTFPDIPDWDDVGTTDSDEQIMVAHNWDEIRRLMWNYVGIVRSDKRLARAQRRIDTIQNEISEYYWNFKVSPDLIELRNIATVAELIIKCAAHRKESRGLHYNIGYPQRDDRRWQKDTVIRRQIVGSSKMKRQIFTKDKDLALLTSKTRME